MHITGKRILTAMMVAGAAAGLLAIVLLPGRWDNSAEAHITAGVEIVDTAALVASHAVDPAGAFDDANPGAALLVDTDADTVGDTIVVSAGTAVTVVAHAHTGAADAANGSDVTLTATGSAVFQARSRAGASGELEGAAAGVGDGLLTAISDTQTVIAQTLADVDDGVVVGLCNDAADTCIDGLNAGTATGIAIVQVRSGVPSSSTITATTAAGSDTVDIIWTGVTTSVVVAASNATFTAAQSVIAEADVAALAPLNGDPDLTISATISDTAGNPVPADADVDCAILAAAELTQANLTSPPADAGTISAGANAQNNLADASIGLKVISLESVAGNVAGDVTVTCWSNTVVADNVLDALEPSGTVTVHVSDVPATIVLAGDTTMGTGGTQLLTGTVTDAGGDNVADGTACTFTLIDPSLIAGLVPAGGATTTLDGVTLATLVVGGEGNIFVNLVCGLVSDMLAVTVSGVAPTETPVPGTATATITPGGPTLTPEPPTATATPATPVATATATATEAPPEDTATPEPPCLVGDVNDDGAVNSIDASLILQLDAGLIDELPRGETC